MKLPASDMFRDELEMFAETCATGKPCELSAHNGNVAVAIVNAALRSIDRNGQLVRLTDVMNEARTKVSTQTRQAA